MENYLKNGVDISDDYIKLFEEFSLDESLCNRKQILICLKNLLLLFPNNNKVK
jgi:hypothetical protein